MKSKAEKLASAFVPSASGSQTFCSFDSLRSKVRTAARDSCLLHSWFYIFIGFLRVAERHTEIGKPQPQSVRRYDWSQRLAWAISLHTDSCWNPSLLPCDLFIRVTLHSPCLDLYFWIKNCYFDKGSLSTAPQSWGPGMDLQWWCISLKPAWGASWSDGCAQQFINTVTVQTLN